MMRAGGIIAALAAAAIAAGGLWWVMTPPPDGLAADPAADAADAEAAADLAGAEGIAAPHVIGDAPGADEVDLTAPAPTALPEGTQVALPSGRQAVWLDSAQDTLGAGGLTFRYRFVANGLSAPMTETQQAALQTDMAALCQDWALPRVARPGPVPAQIVITLMSRAVGFGEVDEEVLQFFEAYSLQPGPGAAPDALLSDPATPLACRWELY